MIVNINKLKLKEKVPKQCPELYWELRKLGARPYQANWKSKSIHNHKEGEELSIGTIYSDMRKLGIDAISSLKIEILFWADYDKRNPISSYEAGLILNIENRKNFNYVTSILHQC